jgi:murein DD-endopeptidase MepM/ murein hydrolase activator NlpD
MISRLSACLLLLNVVNAGRAAGADGVSPLLRIVDLDVGESADVVLSDGSTATVKLIDLSEERDAIRNAVRRARVTVDVNGEQAELETGMYNLPQPVGGVQVDCTVTSGYNENGTPGFWGLEKDARLRLWPADSPWIQPGSFLYPVRQNWFASLTWFDNEPVDGGAAILPKIYYHAGLDIGGTEAMTEVVSATDALVVSAGEEVLEGHRDGTPVAPRYDVVYLLDERGWYYRYSHLHVIDEQIRPGREIEQGARIGLVGKEGASGGWSHLHFEIKARQPSGRWGTQAGYAFLWQAYVAEQQPDLIAVARPQQFVRVGETVRLDGSRSWSADGQIEAYEWTLEDVGPAEGAVVEREYDRPGTYSEILKVTDADGNVDYDFAVVHVIDRNETEHYPPRLHATFHPTIGIAPGKEVTFKVRSFGIEEGREVWDFGDGTPPVAVHSDGNAVPLAAAGYAVTTHAFAAPGDYIVRVERGRADGVKAVGHLHVRVEE